jgi:hypothetical protein
MTGKGVVWGGGFARRCRGRNSEHQFRRVYVMFSFPSSTVEGNYARTFGPDLFAAWPDEAVAGGIAKKISGQKVHDSKGLQTPSGGSVTKI